MSANTCRYLTALLTEGSFSKAAQTLDISQPSLSQFLLRLETEAGTTLIENLNSGIYILKATGKDGKTTAQKFIVK